MVEQLNFPVTNISCHAWNKDRTQLALSPSNNEVHIYKRIDKLWQLTDVLNQHELTVTDVDWAPNTNRIVTSAADRNAYVWSQGDDGKWKPTLVLLRTNRAATCVKWSPFENKFAVGSGARLISVGYFDKVYDWWVSKHIKKPILSTVTALDWHPNNMLLVCGSTDYRVRIFSAFIKCVESPPNDNSPWCSGNSSLSLGTLLAEFRNSSYGGGWVHNVSFSGDGNRVCWVGHDSSLSVADATRGKAVTKCRTENLPYKCCLWVSPSSIVVGGFNCCPLLYNVDANGQITFVSKLDTTQKKEAAGLSAMHKFQSLDRQAVVINETSLSTLHQNAITCLLVHTGSKGNVTKFSTSGRDDKIIIWDLQKLENSMQNLKLN